MYSSPATFFGVRKFFPGSLLGGTSKICAFGSCTSGGMGSNRLISCRLDRNLRTRLRQWCYLSTFLLFSGLWRQTWQTADSRWWTSIRWRSNQISGTPSGGELFSVFIICFLVGLLLRPIRRCFGGSVFIAFFGAIFLVGLAALLLSALKSTKGACWC